MNIKEIIGKIMVVLDEVTSQNLEANASDYVYKIYPLIDSVQTEIATDYKPIEKYMTIDSVNKRIDEPADCFKFLKVYNTDLSPIKYLHYNKKIYLVDEESDGTFTLYYNKYPDKVGKDTQDNYELEIDRECQEALVYGVCAGICINDEPELYDTYTNKYYSILSNITARMQNNVTATIIGGVRI